MSEQKPSVGRIVHYVDFGTPGGEYTSQCRAAIVTEVSSRDCDTAPVGLCVLNPEGQFFNQHVHQDELPPAEKIVPGERTEHRGGTWHWPERV